MESVIGVQYGSIDLDAERSFEFFVFERNPNFSREVLFHIQTPFREEQFLIGVLARRSWYKRFGKFSYWCLMKINTKEKLKFLGSIDEPTKKEIVEKILKNEIQADFTTPSLKVTSLN